MDFWATNRVKELHWLPYRIDFKILCFAYSSYYQLSPPYLTELVKLYTPKRSLRSENKLLLDVPRQSSKFGYKAFSSSVPVLWNNLPPFLKQSPNLGSFKKNLKTEFFRAAFL